MPRKPAPASDDAAKPATPARRKPAAKPASAPRAAKPTAKGERTCVLVLGMHRSGTSAFTRVLNLLGCQVPASLMAANANNPTGYWESVRIFQLNTRLLASAGSAWDDWLEFPESWYRSPPAKSFLGEAQELLSEEFGENGFYALKDPRLCRILPFWLDVLKAQNTRAVAVVPLRHPLEVAGSMQRRDGFDPAYGALLWLRHVLDGERLSRGLTRVFVTYDDLLADWQSVIARTESAFGFSWPGNGPAARSAISSYLSDGHRHHAIADDALDTHPTLPAWVGEAYRILTRWAREGETAADFARLDAIRAEMDEAARVFGGIIASGRAAIERESDHLEALEDAATEKSALEARLEDAKAVAQELDDTRHMRNLTARELAEVRADLETERAAHGETRETRDNAAARVQSLEGSLADTTALLEAERTARAELEGRLAQTRIELEKARAIVLWLRKALGVFVPSNAGIGGAVRRLMPLAWHDARARARLERAGVFSADEYRAVNPDLPRRGTDPLAHYVRHGLAEGRPAGRRKHEG
ncbi:MAG: hypothetical protein ACQRW7_05355 [Caulobacterales bacterium]|uniref:sulfotransferase family protein n=1 Tax=Glycocaulis sp. TaxID=1969725 RepID=UPI003FA114DD